LISEINRISEIKKSFYRIRDTINELDNSLSVVLSIEIIIAMFNIMFQIFVYILFQNFSGGKTFTLVFTYRSVESVVKLILTYFFNGLTHEESDQLYAVLDGINTEKLSKRDYKELHMFKTNSRNIKCGFTIGGFAPLRKTTFLSVDKL
jgi:hypothetical protein